MQYVNLGHTGLKVSKLCLGMMTYGDTAWRQWVLTEEQGRPFIRRAFESGINFVDTADMYSLGVSEEITGRAMKDFAQRDDMVIATKVFSPMGAGPNDRGLSRKHILRRSTDRCGGWARTTSTCTRSTAGIRPRRSKRRSPRSTTSCAPAKRAISARRAWPRGSSRRRCTCSDRHGWARFVSMQNHYNLVYREEEREMLPLCAPRASA